MTDTAIFDEIVAGIEPTLDASGFRQTEGRRSIKYRFSYAGQGISDYVFAENPADAEAKARSEFNVADDVEVTVTRICESTGKTGGGMNGIGANGTFRLAAGPKLS